MKKIWKYELPTVAGSTSIEMPFGANILTVQEQHNKPCLWIEADTSAGMRAKYFTLVETGKVKDPEYGYKYIGTVQLDGGSYVLHVYERI